MLENEYIFKDKREINYLFFKESSDYLIIVFSGYPVDTPKYQYINYLSDIKSNRLYILDNFGFMKRGCWYLCEKMDFTVEESIINLIRYIQETNNIQDENVILGGSSKGGFASLYYGIKYKFGHIIAAAPQVFLGNYLVANKYFEKILEEIGTNDTLFNKKFFNDILINLPICNKSKFYFYCGIDDFHLQEHLTPLIRKINKNQNLMYIDIFKGGHSVGPIFGPKLNEIVKSIIKNSVNFTSQKKTNLFINENIDIDKIENEFDVKRTQKNLDIKKDDNNLKFSIIVAIYNNGQLLLNRCFRSLKESSMFENIEIILVDDGSSDNETIDIMKNLQQKYSNVKTYFFETGGSGSAARPRNKGVKIATTNYISYLDPDNEAANDGYTKLYHTIIDGTYDMVVGNIIFDDGKKKTMNNYYSKFLKANAEKDESNDGKNTLIKTLFMAESIQAALIKKDLVISNNLTMVNGAIGEDTLFFYELILNSKKTKVINEVIHIYYNKEEGSVTNVVDKKFFEKYLIIEPIRKQTLEKYGLLKQYLEKRYEPYFLAWYIQRLRKVKIEEKEECEKILDKIYDIYKDVWDVKNKDLKNYFIQRNIYDEKQFKFTIIIAAYNNGNYLKDRCIKSLKRSSMFKEIEIIIVDDGSSDKNTLDIINTLEKEHKNIRTYFFESGGSGSASRPRNKGVELATTEYITYLDPDNEAFGDSYKKLYDEIIDTGADIVIGNILFVDSKGKKINDYYNAFLKINDNNYVSYDGKKILCDTNFMAQSIQASLIKKRVLTDNNLAMVNGSIGEDTLFFYQLLIFSKKIKVIKDIVHSYYTSVEGSTTNTIDINYFYKHLLLEKEKRKFLQNSGLLNIFLQTKHENYFKAWIFNKLKDTNREELLKAQDILDEIYILYEDVWIIKNNVLLSYFKTRKIYNERSMKMSIIVPIYNNGSYLIERCIDSLRRSSMFDDMEIILVDDGSTDNYTIDIVKQLEREYKNIKTYFFERGGSGSASRPRNYGIKLATTNYISYLDPDNEAVGDGYFELFTNILGTDYDMVIGNILFKLEDFKCNDYYNKFLAVTNQVSEGNNCKDILLKTDFIAQSIQACIIRKDLIINNNLNMVEGAIGQDTLFFYELMLTSKKVKVIDDNIHIYYTKVKDSVTNTIDINYFKKHLLLEQEKRKRLEKYNVLEEYLDKRQDAHFAGYIFEKLKNVKEEDYKESEKIVNQIYNLYADKWQLKYRVLKSYFNK